MRKIFCFFILMFFFVLTKSQGLYNNGTSLQLPSGIYLTLNSGSFSNSNNSTDGTLTLGGEILVEGHWTNDANSVLNLSGGEVKFDGISTQFISGRNRTEFYNLNILSGSVVEVPADEQVTVNNDLTISGTLTLKSASGSATASLIDGAASGGTNTGTLKVERYLEGSTKYHFVSSPVNNSSYTVLQDARNGNYNVYYYDETNTSQDKDIGWQTIKTGNLNNAQGYTAIYTSNTTRTFESSLNTGSDITIDVTNTSSGDTTADGWNLIGNPFPSPFSLSDFLTDNTALNGIAYFWDDDGSTGSGYSTADYASHNGTGGTAGTGGGSGNTPNGTIAIGQAFFVKKTNVGTSTVTFKNSYRTHSTSTQFFVAEPTNISRFKLSISNAKGLYNEILIGFLEEATYGHDRLYDGDKLRGNPNIALYSIANNREYVIQGLPQLLNEEIVPIGLFVKNDGNYVFKNELYENFKDAVNVLLVDKELNSEIDLTKLDSVNLFLKGGTHNNRFFLKFNSQLSNDDTKVKRFKEEDCNVLVNGKTLIFTSKQPISGKIFIYDMLGKNYLTLNIDKQTYQEFELKIASGYYLANFFSTNQIISKRLSIAN